MRQTILFLMILTGCAAKPLKMSVIRECAKMQTEFYNDLCAEARGCQFFMEDGDPRCSDEYAYVHGYGSLLIQSHFEGVSCAAQAIVACVESEIEE